MNSSTKRATLAAAAATGMLGLLSATAQAVTPDPGKPIRTYTEKRFNPVTGKTETAKITEYPDVIKRGGRSTTGSDPNPDVQDNQAPSLADTLEPARGTGGLYLRDAGGVVKGLMGEGDRARVIACHPTNPNLVKVEQITSGHGGWGPYVGYVNRAATAQPSRITCG